MELRQWAEQILFSHSLNDKLQPLPVISDVQPHFDLKTPKAPGRPYGLELNSRRQQQRVAFPKSGQLDLDRNRGLVLHFFANHELLALELMALALLKFPEASAAFRRGLAAIMQQEQNHMQLYLQRMKELGVEFGDIAVNDFFWVHLAPMPSLKDFLAHMSLTFEQANLDFAIHYHKLFHALGDQATAAIMDVVYREEISHVGHGLHWFKEWSDPQLSEWQNYTDALRAPISPSRAKGLVFDLAGRKQAGFSQEYIDELTVFSRSKSRPANLYIYNPDCEQELAAPGNSYSPSQQMRDLIHDFAPLMMMVAKADDMVLVSAMPRRQHLLQLKQWGLELPEFIEGDNRQLPAVAKIIAERQFKIHMLHSWGWSAAINRSWQAVATSLKQETADNQIPRFGQSKQAADSMLSAVDFYSKKTSMQAEQLLHAKLSHKYGFLQPQPQMAQWCCSIEQAWQCLQVLWASGAANAVLKGIYGASGRNFYKVRSAEEFQQLPLQNWLIKQVQSCGGVIVEAWHKRLADYSMLLNVSPHKKKPILAIRRTLVDDRGQYWGHVLNHRNSLEPELAHQLGGGNVLLDGTYFDDLAQHICDHLLGQGYVGPASVDFYVGAVSQNGRVFLRLFSEINCRYSMGRLALPLEKRISARSQGVFLLLPMAARSGMAESERQIWLQGFYQRHSLLVANNTTSGQWQRGCLFLNDPIVAREKVAALVCGSSLEEIMAPLSDYFSGESRVLTNWQELLSGAFASEG